MSERYYPELPDGVLTGLSAIRTQLMEDPTFLDGEDCPYSSEDRAALLRMFTLNRATVEQEPSELPADVSDEEIGESVDALYRDLKQFGQDFHKSSDAKDRASYFRVAVALTDKIVTLRERAYKLRDWKSFQSQFMAWAEGLDADVRTDLMDRIKDWT